MKKFLLTLIFLLSFNIHAESNNISAENFQCYSTEKSENKSTVNWGIREANPGQYFGNPNEEINLKNCFNFLRWLATAKASEHSGTFVYQSPITKFKKECRYSVIKVFDEKSHEEIRQKIVILYKNKDLVKTLLLLEKHEDQLLRSVEVVCELLSS